MDFGTFYVTLNAAEKKRLASKSDTSVVYLRALAKGRRMAGASISARLKQADRRINDLMLRPDLYGSS